MPGDSTLGQLADSDWATFMAKLEAAEHELVQGRPAALKALWSGWDKVASRLDWASSQFSDSTPSREEIRSAVGAVFAYIVQTEHIRFRVPGRTEESTLELRVTMVFRREVLSRSKNPLKNATIAHPPG